MEVQTVRLFPGGTVVSVPASIHVPGDCLVLVRLAAAEQVSEARERLGARIAGWEVEEEACASTELWDRLDGLPVRARVPALAQLEDSDLLERLQALKPFCILRPDTKLLRALNLLTSAGIPVRIDTSVPLDAPDALVPAVEHYLHSPTLGTPIEPFHGLLLALSTGGPHSLWELESEEVDLNFHVTQDCRVTLSRRWAEGGRDYGSANDPWDHLVQSDTYTRLATLPVDLLGSGGPCATCEHFGLCKGFLRAVDPNQPCEAWQTVFGRLKEAVSTARRVLAEEDRSQGGAAP